MPLFISYSHADAEFVSRLAGQLVKHRAHVWVDQWELSVGDSLIDKVQHAIAGASGLLIVLSKSSVESEWCKKELSAGLIRELEEKRVVVLPILLEDCNIPLFLRDKVYADFRTNFDDGIQRVVTAIAKVTSEHLMRIDAPEWNVDWAIDWGVDNVGFFMHLTAVEQAVNERFCVLTEIHIVANQPATNRYLAFHKVDLAWVERAAILDSISESLARKDLRILLEDEKRKTTSVFVTDAKSDCEWRVELMSRRLGEETGKDVLVDVVTQLRKLAKGDEGNRRQLTPEERQRIAEIQRAFERNKANPFEHVKF